jgi:tRNA 5-methylaminomethyl-2-thiouridine biosynthesis bifunctional protein
MSKRSKPEARNTGTESGRFKVTPCDGGGSTLFDEELGQAMHSRVGPELEARSLYAEACRLREAFSQPQQSPLLIWDVGMGTASNVWSIVDAWNGTSKQTENAFSVHSFECYPEGLEAALGSLGNFEWLRPLEVPARNLLQKDHAPLPGGTWRLTRGDFREALSHPALETPDYIFFDFYAPKSAPELWSEEMFKKLRELSHSETVLSTYSSATWVRANMRLSGWRIAPGPSTTAKWESTLASPTSEGLKRTGRIEFGEAWMGQVERSEKLSPEIKARLREKSISTV